MSDVPFCREQLHRDGYVLLRQAIPANWLGELRDAFDANVVPSSQWPVPRDSTWRFSMLDLDARVQAVCRLPCLLAAAGELIGESFFLSQVEGREPLPGHGHQMLHRDMNLRRPGDTVHAMAFFDDYGPDNGATRLVPGTHRPGTHEPAFDFLDESRTVQLEGKAGDLLVFDSDLVHAGSLNPSGNRRRSLLFCYFADVLRDAHGETAFLRNVRMDVSASYSRDGRLIAESSNSI